MINLKMTTEINMYSGYEYQKYSMMLAARGSRDNIRSLTVETAFLMFCRVFLR